ncbi:VOC family protein [Thermobispora bispora]
MSLTGGGACEPPPDVARRAELTGEADLAEGERPAGQRGVARAGLRRAGLDGPLKRRDSGPCGAVPSWRPGPVRPSLLGLERLGLLPGSRPSTARGNSGADVSGPWLSWPMIEVHTVTFDSHDPYRIARWWSDALGWPMGEGGPEDDEILVERPGGRPHLLFQRVPEGKSVKNRLHLDLRPADRTRDEEVERLIALGATLHEDHRFSDGTGWVVLLDPDGNEFCVCRSDAERAAGPS